MYRRKFRRRSMKRRIKLRSNRKAKKQQTTTVKITTKSSQLAKEYPPTSHPNAKQNGQNFPLLINTQPSYILER